MGHGLSRLQKSILAAASAAEFVTIAGLVDGVFERGSSRRKTMAASISRAVTRLEQRGFIQRDAVYNGLHQIWVVRLANLEAGINR